MNHPADLEHNKFTNLANPKFNHKELEDDDCGLPENPVYSNYAKYLWKRAVKNGLVPAFPRSQPNPDPPLIVK